MSITVHILVTASVCNLMLFANFFNSIVLQVISFKENITNLTHTIQPLWWKYQSQQRCCSNINIYIYTNIYLCLVSFSTTESRSRLLQLSFETCKLNKNYIYSRICSRSAIITKIAIIVVTTNRVKNMQNKSQARQRRRRGDEKAICEIFLPLDYCWYLAVGSRPKPYQGNVYVHFYPFLNVEARHNFDTFSRK